MDIQLIDRYAGFDSQTYFCRGCGRAGYKSISAVRGHLSVCPSRSGVQVVGGAGSEVVGGAGGAGAGAGQNLNLDRIWGVLQDISQRQVRMEQVLFNELPHQIATVQAQRQSFDDKWLKWVIVGYIALWFLRKLGDESIVKRAGGKIGDKMLGKAIDGLLGL